MPLSHLPSRLSGRLYPLLLLSQPLPPSRPPLTTASNTTNHHHVTLPPFPPATPSTLHHHSTYSTSSGTANSLDHHITSHHTTPHTTTGTLRHQLPPRQGFPRNRLRCTHGACYITAHLHPGDAQGCHPARLLDGGRARDAAIFRAPTPRPRTVLQLYCTCNRTVIVLYCTVCNPWNLGCVFFFFLS